MKTSSTRPRYRPYTPDNFHTLPQLDKISPKRIEDMKLTFRVLPFRVSNYVVDELIDWDRVPEDPVFQLTFPQPEMIPRVDFCRLRTFVRAGNERAASDIVRRIHRGMNPHPAGQMDLNVPFLGSEVLTGMQHKYDETVLFFPTQGQTCHSYCTYCFRWPQFVGLDTAFRFACSDETLLPRYITEHPEVTDVLFTGGDPLVMHAKLLRKYLSPLLEKKPGNLHSIRFGTKSLAYWPYRFTEDKDADDIIRLFEEITEAGYHLSVMAHFSHDRELSTPAVEKAMARIRSTGAQIRCQAPLIRHVNDDPGVWSAMWKRQVALGAVPYYMFMERDTGPRGYFNVPLVEAHRIFTEAYRNVSGLCRTVRGPSMSAGPGKILMDGVAEVGGEQVILLKFIQARNPDWVNRIFFAAHNPKAHWIDDLKPAFGKQQFFYEAEYIRIQENIRRRREGFAAA
ncbi:L-lysine 2,3-aminomutase [Desulfobotulus alkaliphilus]|uniref:L-lysine 2,3-aminomutase n=1 Tax=Desulfobotulus alkaliphilus TaxID=622671 RepID=A0A562S762_9BACT|nr:lysine 2,3-aminomutase [Desulfobotulus alkaliphilus]TWI77245.1 L-lysine 2,3-aminomutase [Desulfobotulus alkaliphilus]